MNADALYRARAIVAQLHGASPNTTTNSRPWEACPGKGCSTRGQSSRRGEPSFGRCLSQQGFPFASLAPTQLEVLRPPLRDPSNPGWRVQNEKCRELSVRTDHALLPRPNLH